MSEALAMSTPPPDKYLISPKKHLSSGLLGHILQSQGPRWGLFFRVKRGLGLLEALPQNPWCNIALAINVMQHYSIFSCLDFLSRS